MQIRDLMMHNIIPPFKVHHSHIYHILHRLSISMQASLSGCEDYIADYIAREIISQRVNTEGHLHMFDKSEGGLKCMK